MGDPMWEHRGLKDCATEPGVRSFSTRPSQDRTCPLRYAYPLSSVTRLNSASAVETPLECPDGGSPAMETVDVVFGKC